MKVPFEQLIAEQSNAASCCEICGRSVSQLEPFGGPGDPLVGDFSGRKLVKRWREDFPRYNKSSWECRNCIVRPGGLWEIEKEDRLGRPLSQAERRRDRYEFCRGEWEYVLHRKLLESEKGELWVQLDDWKPEGWEPEPTGTESGVRITLTAEEIREAVNYVHKLQPYWGSR